MGINENQKPLTSSETDLLLTGGIIELEDTETKTKSSNRNIFKPTIATKPNSTLNAKSAATENAGTATSTQVTESTIASPPSTLAATTTQPPSAPAVTKQHPPPFTGQPIGVSIEFIRWFLNKHYPPPDPADSKYKMRARFSYPTTTDMCQKIVIPETTPTQSSYIDLIPKDQTDANGKPFLGPATVFVSHAWKFRFDVPLDVMEQHATKEPETYFWFDLFINNQNIASSLPQEWWKTTFRQSIKTIGTVLLVLSPWDRPIPVTRAWCLWEIMSALSQDGVRFIGKIPNEETMRILSDITLNGSYTGIQVPHIDSANAEAFKQDDRDMILGAIRETLGFEAVDKRVGDEIWKSQLEGMVKAAEFVIERKGYRGDSVGRTLNRIGLMLADIEGYKESLQVFEWCLRWDMELDPWSDDTANSYLNVGDRCRNLKEFNTAIEKYEAAIKIYEKNWKSAVEAKQKEKEKEMESDGDGDGGVEGEEDVYYESWGNSEDQFKESIVVVKRDIGFCYRDLQDFTKAVENMKAYTDYYEAQLKQETYRSEKILLTYVEIASALWELGDKVEALANLEKGEKKLAVDCRWMRKIGVERFQTKFKELREKFGLTLEGPVAEGDVKKEEDVTEPEKETKEEA
jgi:tetratricopeptide (TPR) repeat protein